MSTRTDVLSSKEVGELISASQMLLYSLISPIELKQGLITDKKAPHLCAYKERDKGGHLAFWLAQAHRVQVMVRAFGSCMCPKSVSLWM